MARVNDWTFRAAQLPQCVMENKFTSSVRSPADIAALVPELVYAAQESMVVLDLNAKNKVIDKRLVTLGLVDSSLTHPREIFRGAISNNASAVILIHNHPSGDPTPSAEDIRITRQMVEAGKVIDIKILDHIIIGRPSSSSSGWLSLREAGLVSFV